MTVGEIMEIAGVSKTGTALQLIKDAMTEIELLSHENVTQYKTNLVKDQATYNLPSNLIEVLNVKIKDTDSEYYCPLSRVIIENYKEK